MCSVAGADFRGVAPVVPVNPRKQRVAGVKNWGGGYAERSENSFIVIRIPPNMHRHIHHRLHPTGRRCIQFP